MRYDLLCKECGLIDEHIMGMNDKDLVVHCSGCGAEMTRRDNFIPTSAPQVIGITSGNVRNASYDGYFDPGLGLWVKSKEHRTEEMKKRGLAEYSLEGKAKAFDEEKKYIRRNSNPGDRESAAAIAKINKAEDKARRTDSVNAVIDKAFKNL